MASEQTQTPIQYLDFDIAIRKGEGYQYLVSVGSHGGDAGESISLTFDLEEELRKFLNILGATFQGHGDGAQLAPSGEEGAQEFGGKLFQAFFPEKVRNYYASRLATAQAQGKGLRIRLNILADELSTIPWEYLFDPIRESFLSLSRHTPVVRYLHSEQYNQCMEVSLPLQVLGMISNPSADFSALKTEVEKENLEKALEPLIQAGYAKLTWLKDGSWRTLLDALTLPGRQWHIFHFIGHGRYDPQAKKSFIAFEGPDGHAKEVDSTSLSRLLAEHTSLRLVLLNACGTAFVGGQGDIFSSMAAKLVQRGLPAVIAMQCKISDPAAIELSQSFYKSLTVGMPVDAAISRARLALSFAIEDTLEWGTPVLYMRTEDGVLFRFHIEEELPPRSKQEIGATENTNQVLIEVTQVPQDARQPIMVSDYVVRESDSGSDVIKVVPEKTPDLPGQAVPVNTPPILSPADQPADHPRAVVGEGQEKVSSNVITDKTKSRLRVYHWLAVKKQYSPEQKAQVVLEIIEGSKDISQIASAHGIHPHQLQKWKEQALEGLWKTFEDKGEDQAAPLADQG